MNKKYRLHESHGSNERRILAEAIKQRRKETMFFELMFSAKVVEAIVGIPEKSYSRFLSSGEGGVEKLIALKAYYYSVCENKHVDIKDSKMFYRKIVLKIATALRNELDKAEVDRQYMEMLRGRRNEFQSITEGL